ncbi:MAG: MBL fold metallo-hydrolase [Desulfobacterales bacterium]|nr:MBL fold metallo-hydrolase [Desulfobacterales bacterium]
MNKNLRRALLFSAAALFYVTFISPLCQASDLKIYCIDADQGSSTLIVAPNGKSLLIDCGEAGASDSIYNVINEIAGLSSLNFFVCTHYHDDHYGGLDSLINKGISVTDKYYDRDSDKWLSDARKRSSAYRKYRRLSQGKREYLRPGATISLDDNMKIECVVANGRAKGEYGTIEYPPDENGYSIGLMISYNGFDFLILGDLNEDVESKLVGQNVLKDIDVYVVNHHGAETSSCQALLDAIRPEVCIISSGTNGTYRHPRKKTVQRLKELSSVKDIYQLNKNMDASQYPNTIMNLPDDHIGDLDCTGSEGTLLITANQDTYTIMLIERGNATSFNIERQPNYNPASPLIDDK